MVTKSSKIAYVVLAALAVMSVSVPSQAMYVPPSHNTNNNR